MTARSCPGVFLVGAVLAGMASTQADDRAPSDGNAFFEATIRPILQAKCVECHGGGKVKGGLDLSSRDGLLKGGDRGASISLEDPLESVLLEAVEHQELKMPPKGKLPQAQIDALTRWVEMGAPWSAGGLTAKGSGPPPVDNQARNFWSFRPVVRPEPPQLADTPPSQAPIDRFIRAKLASAGLTPAPPAERTTLLRRATYDLTGLPPTPQEVTAFLDDQAPDAFERVIDRLLGSPRYGERWGRHWLDLVRYAETNGYEFDAPKPNAYRYRDYVIKSLNADKPYDRFLKEQLAGDELAPSSDEALIATGYYRVGAWDSGAPDKLQAVFDELDDLVGTTSQVFLGLTANCARCHDHKSDPFPTADYYRLTAFFRGVRPFSPRSALKPLAAPSAKEVAALAETRAKIDKVGDQIKAIEDALLPHLSGVERDEFLQSEQTHAEIWRLTSPRTSARKSSTASSL